MSPPPPPSPLPPFSFICFQATCIKGIFGTGMANLHLKTMIGIFFLLIFEPRISLENEMKSPGGLKVQITHKGLALVKDKAMQMLMSRLMEDEIQDQSSSYNVSLLGEITLSISNIQIEEIVVMDSVAYFVQSRGIGVVIRDVQIMFTGNWKIENVLGQNNVMVQTDIKGLSLSVYLGLDVDDGGRALLQHNSCSAKVADIDLKFLGPRSSLYAWIFQSIKRNLISDISEGVCTEVKKSIEQFSQHLRNTEPWVQVDYEAGIDFSLVSKPEITGGQLNLDLKGEFFSVHQRQRSPLIPTPILLPDQPPSMFVIGVSDFLLNSAAFVYFTRNTLQVKYTDETIPKGVPFRLNTQSVGLLLPELKRQFPGRPMELHLEARKEPKLHFHPGGLDATLLGRAKAVVVLPNSSQVPVFALHLDCDFTGQIALEADPSGDSLAKVKGSVALKSLHLSEEWSGIGEIKVSHLETLLKIAGHMALSRLNKKLQEGKLLASLYGVSLVDPEVSMHEGYMLIKTDVQLPHPTNTNVWLAGRADGVKEG